MDLKINKIEQQERKKMRERSKKGGKYDNKTMMNITSKNTEGKKNTTFRQYTCKYEKGTKGKKIPGINPSGPLDHPLLLQLRCMGCSLNRSMQALPAGP